MLTRPLLRTKIAQVLYANFQSNNDLQYFDNELNFSLKKSYDLYHFLLLLPNEITFIAEKEVIVLTNKLLKTEQNISSIQNLAENSFSKLLAKNVNLIRYTRDNSIYWSDYEDEILEIYERLKLQDFFKKYTDNASDFDVQKTFWRKFFRSNAIFNEQFEDFLENLNIYWNDDLQVTLDFIDKTLALLKKENCIKAPLLPMYKDESDREFVIKLAHTAFLNSDKYNELLKNNIKNWNINRINPMDIVLIKMALAEIESFPFITINITLNEYIEIAKFYSTPDSSTFINGVVHNIAQKWLDEGKLQKVNA